MKSILIAIAAGLCWGIGESFTKSVLHSDKIGPFTAMAARTTVALPFLWLAAWWVLQSRNPEPADWIRAEPSILMKLVIGSGLIAGALGMLLFYSALQAGDLSRVKPVAFATAIVAAVVLGMIVFNEPFHIRKLIATVMIVGGILLTAWK